MFWAQIPSTQLPWEALLSPFHTGRNEGSEKWNDLLNIIQLMSDGVAWFDSKGGSLLLHHSAFLFSCTSSPGDQSLLLSNNMDQVYGTHGWHKDRAKLFSFCSRSGPGLGIQKGKERKSLMYHICSLGVDVVILCVVLFNSLSHPGREVKLPHLENCPHVLDETARCS